MIVLFLVAAAGNVGRFIALAFILLQVQTTGTSLPIDMLPESIRTLSNFLPLTYSIDAFRNIIILGDLGSVFSDMFILLIYLAVSVVLAFIVFTVKYKNFADTPNEQLELTT
jgi:putative membrane protein